MAGRFVCLTCSMHFNREGLGIEADFSLPTVRVIRALDQIIEWRRRPRRLRCDNGPEFISQDLETWADKHDIQLEFIQPGSPQQNAAWHLLLASIKNGMITICTMGGIFRDILCNEQPVVFSSPLYATVSWAGSLAFIGLLHLNFGVASPAIIAGTGIFVLRLIAIRFIY